MANVLHKTRDPTDYRVSVNTPDFPVVDWFINPDVSAVAGISRRYWKRPLADPVIEMSQAEKDAVDVAVQTALETDTRAALTDAVDGTLPEGVDVRSLIQLTNKRDNFNTARILELQNRVQAMLDSTGVVANMRTDGLAVSISATATRPRSDAVQDYKDDINAGVND